MARDPGVLDPEEGFVLLKAMAGKVGGLTKSKVNRIRQRKTGREAVLHG